MFMRYTGKGLAHVPHMVGKQKLKTFPSLPTVICVSWSSTVAFCNIYCCYFVGFFWGGRTVSYGPGRLWASYVAKYGLELLLILLPPPSKC